MNKDSETLALCDRFFDAIEQKDFATVERCYAPEAIVWHSHDCLYQSRASNLETLRDGMSRLKKMRYRNRRIHVFEGGFVQQHTLDVCFIGYTRDGMISRAYEYFDTGQIEKFLGPRPVPQASGEAASAQRGEAERSGPRPRPPAGVPD